MMFLRISFICLVTTFGFSIHCTDVIAQEVKSPIDLVAKRNISKFLETSDELRNYSRNGFTSTFTGEFVPIDNKISKELDVSFQAHRFYVARMLVDIDPPPKRFDLVLILNKKTLKVEGYVWADYWMIRPSRSFNTVLKEHRPKTKEIGLTQGRLIANLLLSLKGGKVGHSKLRKRRIEIELLRGEGIGGLLIIELDQFLRFKRILITDNKGRKLRYFV